MAGERAADAGVDQEAQARKAFAPDADLEIEAPGHLELLRIDWQFTSAESVLPADPTNGVQMAESSKPKEKYDLVSLQPTADPFPSAATAHCGKERSEDALPAGIEFLLTVAGLPATGGRPLGECESELT